MTNDVLLRMALAQRSAIEALHAQNEALVAALESEPSGAIAPEFPAVDGCQHPAAARRPIPGGGPRDFLCSGCRRTSDELTALKEAP